MPETAGWLGFIGGYLFIFGARVVDVSLATVRTIMIVKGRRLSASMLGFVEVIVYIVALRMVFSHLNNWVNLFFYGLGFATGNYVGSILEEKLAFGTVTVQVIPKCQYGHMTTLLREEGYGVTVLRGEGLEGEHHILQITLNRRDLRKLMKTVNKTDCGAFTTIFDARGTRGGYVVRKPLTKRK